MELPKHQSICCLQALVAATSLEVLQLHYDGRSELSAASLRLIQSLPALRKFILLRGYSAECMHLEDMVWLLRCVVPGAQVLVSTVMPVDVFRNPFCMLEQM